MRLDLLYFLTILVLPSIAKTHHQNIFQKSWLPVKKSVLVIPTSHCVYFLDAERLQGMITSVIDALVGADRRAEDVASSASDVSAFPRLVASHYELNLFSFAKNCGKTGAWEEALRSNCRVRAEEGRNHRTFGEPRAN